MDDILLDMKLSLLLQSQPSADDGQRLNCQATTTAVAPRRPGLSAWKAPAPILEFVPQSVHSLRLW